MHSDLQRQLEATLGSDFRFERELGGGGMSRVFLAEETRFARRVVVKVLGAELGATLSGDRFEREIRFAAQLQEPHIVPLIQAGHSGELRYYTMPFVEGETLRTRLARGPLPTDESLAILRDVLMALEYAHERHVVHRDIKPENILLSGRTAVVADFGIAKAISAAAETNPDGTLTALGTVVGTPAYMAPEQAAGDPVDGRTDLYAWAVIAYEMLAGTHPFASSTTAQALLAAQIAEAPVPLAQRRRDLPAGLAALVDRCLAKDPGQRPAGAAAVLEELAALAPAAVTRESRRRRMVAIAAGLLIVAAAGTWFYRRSEERRWARAVAIPEITRLTEAHRSLAALLTARRAARALPGDTLIAAALRHAEEAPETITSEPAGATVAVQDYVTPNGSWDTLGVTPLKNVVVPRGLLRFRLSKPGLGEFTLARGHPPGDTLHFSLDLLRHAPEGMVPVEARIWGDMIAFVGWVGPYHLPAYYMDKFEVTNRQYQSFVNQGGYLKSEYWREPFVKDGHTLAFADAMTLLRDRSGRAGPSTWEGGHYAEGQDDYPVSGVSWYEASAYAAFAGKTLPSFAQWYEAAPGAFASYAVQVSNISRPALAPVGSFKGVGPYGTYDMVGNVREWTMNSLGADRRFILGGAWNSLTYLADDPEALSPFDRSPQNGFRCVRNLGPLPVELTRPVRPFERNFAAYQPASDAVFNAYKAMYAYGKTPLQARLEGVVSDTKDWREEKISYDAPYGDERIAAYLFLPKRVKAPYQTVLFFPSARVEYLSDSHELGDVSFFDYVVQSGRAVLYPVYQDTYERRTLHTRPGVGSAGVVTQRAMEVGRALDYLQTRADIDKGKVGYLGVSMGSAEGVIYTTLQQERLRTVVFLDGGYFLNPPATGGDQADFAPRLKIPTLMVNGRYDFTFSLERAQEPLFRALGAPAADKKHVVLETPHDVRADRTTLVREVLGWLDKYLGRVE